MLQRYEKQPHTGTVRYIVLIMSIVLRLTGVITRMSVRLLTIASATSEMRQGNVVAYPTETFYGLGAIPSNERALHRLIALKQRDEGKPISIILGRAAHVTRFTGPLNPATIRLVSLAWPGPLTVVLPANDSVHELITGGSGTVAVRVPGSAQARILAEAAGGAITATSANVQGQPPPRRPEEVEAYFAEGLAGIAGGEITPGGMPSTLARPMGRDLVVLRIGMVSVETLQEWWTGNVVVPDNK